MPTPSPFSDLEDLKNHLNKVGVQPAPEIEELQLHLDSAVEAVEGWAPAGRAPVGPMVSRDFTERVTVEWFGAFRVIYTPLEAIVQATLASDATIIVDTGFDDFDPLTGIVYRSSLGLVDWNVTYTAGRGTAVDVPSSLKLATLIIAAHIWENQRGPRTRTFFGQASPDDSAGWKFGAGYLIPNRAAHLMKPFTGVLV